MHHADCASWEDREGGLWKKRSSWGEKSIFRRPAHGRKDALVIVLIYVRCSPLWFCFFLFSSSNSSFPPLTCPPLYNHPSILLRPDPGQRIPWMNSSPILTPFCSKPPRFHHLYSTQRKSNYPPGRRTLAPIPSDAHFRYSKRISLAPMSIPTARPRPLSSGVTPSEKNPACQFHPHSHPPTTLLLLSPSPLPPDQTKAAGQSTGR
ncbi:hypothetical protein BX666DRAFT_1484140 [Dichotomocladium elegans]|nr:hypothetical protein BX666DRAFT_1484140 [Dichotomocladium elegans]